MDYEKKYNEALEKARQLCAYPTTKPFINDLQNLFPELKDSEDETIRKRLIRYFRTFRLGTFAGLEPKKIIDWLEKQGEKPQGKSALEAAKEEKVDNANKVEPKDYNDIDPHFGKPIDKVVPKFKVGDWIIFNGLTLYIKEIVKGYYRTISKGGITNSYDWGIDNTARLWSITDAKDGDVLKEGSCIFILRKMKSKNTAITHCCLFDDGDFNLSPTLSLDVDSTFPATKEQRDLLFQKMKEAGYEWDAEKKEPKKIEQKPTDWSEEDNFMYNRIKNLLTDISLAPESINSLSDWLKDLKDRVRPQTTWKPSEEQMDALDSTLKYSQVSHNSFEHLNSLFNDLKKLREE